MLKWEWYDDTNTFRVFTHLLLTANYKPSRYRGYDIPRGSVVTGYPALAKQVGMSVQQVRTVFTRLKSTGSITVRKTPNFSIVSITNWEKFQEDNRRSNSQATVKQQASNSQVTTSKEGKKVRSKESCTTTRGSRLPSDWSLPQEWGEWAEAQGMSGADILREAEVFKNHWLSKAGKDAVKANWKRTWMNWVYRKISGEFK